MSRFSVIRIAVALLAGLLLSADFTQAAPRVVNAPAGGSVVLVKRAFPRLHKRRHKHRKHHHKKKVVTTTPPAAS